MSSPGEAKSSTETTTTTKTTTATRKSTSSSGVLDYEEYKRRVIEEERLKRRRRTSHDIPPSSRSPNQDETSPTDAKNEHVANWLTANGKNNQKKQHFEKTVGEIDRIVEELKMKGVQEPTKRDHHSDSISLTDKQRKHGKDKHSVNNNNLKGILKDSEDTLHLALAKEKLMRDENGQDISEEDEDLSESAENLSLEDSKKKWNEAQKTRYVRAKQPRNVEITLTNEEIFDKRTPVDKESNGWWKSYCQQASHVQFDTHAAQNTQKIYYDSQKIVF
ncbi:uncharacterized protein LOC134855528 [Symsagittifera roscoffensis]|uniref:uncharacterized protein LOC134855528 n=1 Tax=Symsagittifera roscoffensis TaxID=84072 RepID=UPI00307BD5C7